MAVIQLTLTTFSLAFTFLFIFVTSFSPPLPPSPPTVARILRNRGYYLMADFLELAGASSKGKINGWNATGTLFAPSDSAFKNRHRHRGFRPSVSLLLYHTVRSPPLLLSDLKIRPVGSSIRTFSRRRRCIFLRRTPIGDPCLSESPVAKNIRSASCVRIRDPNLFFDGNLAVHGVDGVLDPIVASACRLDTWQRATHLDGVVKALRREGYGAVAEAMESRRDELEDLNAVTVFAVKDGNLPYDSDGIRRDLPRHVVPSRYRLHDLTRMSLGTSRIQTMAPGVAIAVGSAVDGAVTVNGVAVDGNDEVYRNRWAVVVPVSRLFGFDDVGPSPSTENVSFDGNGEVLDSSSGQDQVGHENSVRAPSGGTVETADYEVPFGDPLPRGDDPADVVPFEWCVVPGERQLAPCSLDWAGVREDAL